MISVKPRTLARLWLGWFAVILIVNGYALATHTTSVIQQAIKGVKSPWLVFILLNPYFYAFLATAAVYFSDSKFLSDRRALRKKALGFTLSIITTILVLVHIAFVAWHALT